MGIMDRAKDIIIRGGENISCGEIEAAVFEHSAVAEVAAFGVPHETLGGGGAAYAAPMIKRVSDKFKNARAGTGYGLTETNAISVIMPAPLFPARPTSCGRATPIIDVC